jgi:iron complex outermembrane recepter protein
MSSHFPLSRFLAVSLLVSTPVLRAQTPSAPKDAPAPDDSTVITLGAYQVTASPFSDGAEKLLTSVTIMGADQLRNESPDYTLELLGKIPGLTLTDFNQGVITADVSMRGFNGEGSSAHLRLLVDGVPHNLNNGYNDLGAIFPLEIERIEAVKGTADPRQGLNAVAGSVQVHTFQDFVGQKYKAMAGSFGLTEVQGLTGFRHGPLAHSYFAGYRESDGYRDHSATRKHTFTGKWFYHGDADRWTLGLIARTHEFEADAPGYLSKLDAERTPTASPAFSNTDGGTQENLQLSLHGDLRIGPDLAAKAKLYRNDVRRNRFVRFTLAGAQQERLEDELHTGVTVSGLWRPDGGASPFSLDGGVEFHRQDADNQRFGTITRVRQSVTRNHRYALDNTGAYLNAELKPVSWLRTVAALRADRFDGEMTNRVNGLRTPVADYGTIWQPKFSVSAQAHRTTQVYASYGRAFQIGSGAAAFSAKPIDESKNDGTEVGVHFTPLRAFTVRLALWRQTATDEVRLKPDGSGDSENIGETKREGWDLEASWRARDNLTVWASYTRQEGTLVNPGSAPADALLRGRQIDHVPEFTTKAGVDFDATRELTFSASVLGQGDYYLTTRNDTGKFGDYLLVNTDVRYRWRQATFGLHLKNVFDRYFEYVWHDGAMSLHSPGDGRAVFGSVTLAF